MNASRDRGFMVACAIGAVLLLAAAFAPLIAPWAPDAIDLAGRRAPPSGAHWFGTDDLGRDLLSRVLFGARVSLSIGLLAATLTVALGTGIGMLAGWHGRWVDASLMRVADGLLAMPRLPLLMIASVILVPGVPLLIALVAAVSWMETARVVRVEVRALRARGFVEAAHAAGAGTLSAMWRHILPNIMNTVAVATTLAVGRAILLESALSFFGVGVQPPTPSWGNMLYQAQSSMASEPWLALFPGLAILVAVLTVNAVGERLTGAPARHRG
jgi:peptide/nickel transport system permease protein